MNRIRLPKLIRILSLERREEVLDELEKASSPGIDYFLLVILSCSIASFGLITDSPAVIIGAMLVAPLMSPILGLSLASVAGNERMFERAILALIEGVFLALCLSALLGWIARILPFDVLVNLPPEITARTRPNPFDLGIALAGGAAAAYALAQPRLSAALPGVAIATALMPPVCTVGIGISLGSLQISLGATLLFLTNLAAISFAGIVVFFILGFRPSHLEKTWHRIPRSLFLTGGLVLITAIPLVALTLGVVNQAHFTQEIRTAVITELASFPDAQLVNLNIDSNDTTLHLNVTVRTSRQPVYSQVVEFQKSIAARLQRTISLQLIVIPTTKLDPLIPPTFTSTFTPTLTVTPGPSLTPTKTPTPRPTSTQTPTLTVTPSPTSTSTASPTSTLTFTPTQTYTSTPVLAFITNTGGHGVYLRDTPAGKITGVLPEGAAVRILYRREAVNQLEWIEIQDLLGRSGWVQSMYLMIKP